MTENISDSDQSAIAELEAVTGASYDSDVNEFEFASGKNDTEQYVSLVQYLVNGGHITSEDLPISAGQAQTRYLINFEPVHDHRDMIRPRSVGEFYLETNHDSTSKKRYAEMFVEEYLLEL